MLKALPPAFLEAPYTQHDHISDLREVETVVPTLVSLLIWNLTRLTPTSDFKCGSSINISDEIDVVLSCSVSCTRGGRFKLSLRLP